MIFTKDQRSLISEINKITKKVDPIIKKLLSSYVEKDHQELVNYQILTGGKRLRPTLAIICCQMLGGKIKDVLYPAAGLEILHNYTLIIDDIIDNSILRRGKPTTWARFGRSIAQCVGVYYSATILQGAIKSNEAVKISELFAKTLKAIFDGEILDILFERGGREEPYIIKNRYQNITEKDYFNMVSKKTAALFQASCQVGGICARATEKELEALKKFGFNLGISFQIRDDILDIFGKEKEFGKKIGKDIMERKGGNIVILYALKELNLADRQKLLAILRKKDINQKDIEIALTLIQKTASHQKALELSKKFIRRAQKYLTVLPQNKWNNFLKVLAEFVAERGV